MRHNFLTVLLVLFGFTANCLGERVRQQECLDPECRYIMGFEPNTEAKEITFDVTVLTTGYVGFGLAPKASMKDADIVIGGIKNDEPYFQDYHANGPGTPMVDESQNWDLLHASENETHTMLKFKRLLDTCDDDDAVITDNTINVIWSYGETDDIQQHAGTNRGGRQFLLLDPPPAFTNISQFDTHIIRVTNTVPSVKTSYLCSFHKFPVFENQKYLVGVEAFLENQDAVRHTHHFTVTTCRMDDPSILERLVSETEIKAKDCFAELLWIRPHCNEVLFGWAVGGKRVMLPDHVGIPFGEAEDGGEGGDVSLYVMLEVHYENPTEREGVRFTTGFDTFYTGVKRQYEGSIIMIGHEINPALFIPPQSENWVVSGHCDSKVTASEVPPEGINVIMHNMHSHIAGRQIRLRHFRNGTELPWLANDQHYDFDYQQTRELNKEVLLLPGDHLTNECVFNTMDRNVITMGGESTMSEMCHTYIVYYPRIELRGCKSYYPMVELFNKFGVQAIDLESPDMFDPTITVPESMRGKTFSEVVNANEWSKEFREELQQDLRYGHHVQFWASGNYDGQSSVEYLTQNFGNPKSYGKKRDFLPVYTRYVNATDYALPARNCERQATTPEDVPTTPKGNSPSLLSNFKIILASVLIIFSFCK